LFFVAFVGLELGILHVLDSRTSANQYQFLQVWEGSVINSRFWEEDIVIVESKTVCVPIPWSSNQWLPTASRIKKSFPCI